MKSALMVVVFSFLTACNGSSLEETAFKTATELELIELCEKDDECISAVKSQMQSCLDKADWKTYLKTKDSDEHLAAFQKKFIPCFKDSQGDSHFEL